MKKLWEKGYELNKHIEAFITGGDYIVDRKLVKYDCIASIAHAKMLGKNGMLSRDEVDKIVSELEAIIRLDQEGNFSISLEQEDCHTAIEQYLVKSLGDTGKKIHTGRSRNDQVVAALRLYYKEALTTGINYIEQLRESMIQFRDRYGETVLPGYTHMRKAMPSSIKLWAGAFVDSMKDNIDLLVTSSHLIDQSPLGTGAGYGVPLDINRQYTADLLGFKRVQENPIYVQHSRGKFEITILHSLCQVMFDVNKIAMDLIVFSMPEFGFFELPDEFCTGSSMMPQKKNPDVLELLRAKYHKVLSYEFQVRSVLGNLISGYNRDVQLTKKPTLNGFRTTEESLKVLTLVFRNLKVNKSNCEQALTDDLYDTEKVYRLVKQGVPFREAYKNIKK